MMRHFIVTLLVSVFALGALVACTADNNAAIRQTPEVTFANYTPLQLPVNRVDVIPPAVQPGNQTGFGVLPLPLDEMGQRYARQRFAATSGDANMSVVIADIKFSETPLQDKTGSGIGLLTLQRQQKISIAMTLRLEVVEGAKRTSRQEFALERSITLAENLSLSDRDLRLVRFQEGFMAEIDRLMLKKITDIFPNVTVVPAPPVVQ